MQSVNVCTLARSAGYASGSEIRTSHAFRSSGIIANEQSPNLAVSLVCARHFPNFARDRAHGLCTCNSEAADEGSKYNPDVTVQFSFRDGSKPCPKVIPDKFETATTPSRVAKRLDKKAMLPKSTRSPSKSRTRLFTRRFAVAALPLHPIP